MELRSYLGRARGLGSTKAGVLHWWAQRVTAIALVPLSLWFVWSAVGLIGADYTAYRAWVGDHGNLVLVVVFVAVLFHHAQLGVQVVIEDYVHQETLRIGSIIAVRFVAVLAALSAILSALRVALAG